MNLRQLEYFVAIAEEGSFTRAAERLLVAQPSLSQQIAALEAEVGGPLLERLPRGIRLTSAGESFLADARAAIGHADGARRAARMALGLQAGQLEIAAATSAGTGFLPWVLQRWQQRHPEVEVSLHEFAHRRALDEAVRDGDSDMAIGSRPVAWQGPVEHLGWEEFVLVLPNGDPQLGNRSVAIADLADRRWVHYAATHGLAEVVDMRCAAAGFTPRVSLRTSQVGAVARFAAAGLGPALVPDHVLGDDLRPLARHARPRIIREVVAFSRTDWLPITRAFLDVLHEYPWARKPARAVDLG